MLKSGIYAIICKVTGQVYIGSATSIEHRLKQHFRKLRKGTHKNGLLQVSFQKYGAHEFTAITLEECALNELLVKERFWVEEFDSIETGFNVPQLGSNGLLRHGLTHSLAHKSWESMLQRCTNRNASDYPRYGKVGIVVTNRWRSFENFYADMGERPVGTSLDRIDNNLGYKPGNCRWATPLEQQINRDCTVYIEHVGVKKRLREWATEKGIPDDLLRQRVNSGMKGSELFAPSYSRYAGDEGAKKRKRKYVRTGMQRFEYQGKSLTVPELAVIAGISAAALSQRLLRYKIPLEQAMLNVSLRRGKIGPRKGRNMITAFGRTQSMTAWATEFKLPLSTLRNRILRAKMSPEDALSVSVAQQNQ